jgi:hypothetical protein
MDTDASSRRNVMLVTAIGLATASAAEMHPAQAQPASVPRPAPAAQPPGAQVAAARSFAQVTKPADGVNMPAGYVRMMAQMAYAWGWPLVNMSNRRAAITQAPAPGLQGGVVPVAPRGRLAMLVDYVSPNQSFVACPNQDVAYGVGYFSLDVEPVVFQVPDFGDRFWIYALYDARTDQFANLGKPYGTRRGFYLVVGPNWRGRVPAGITAVIRATTELANAVPRVFMDDTAADRAAIRPLINQIMAYPLAEFDGRMKTIDYAALPHFPAPANSGGGETKWVVPERFFAQLPAVMDAVSPLPGEEALFANIRQLLNAGARDPRVAAVMTEAAVQAERDIMQDFFQWQYNGVPAGNGWHRSKNNAQWGVDYFNRTGTAKSNILDNKPTETQYFYTDLDAAGVQLNGANAYSITFPAGQTPPVRGFWSLTLYNEHHLFHANPLNRFSLGTKNRSLLRNADGSLTLHAGGTSPGQGREATWLPAPDGTFSLYIRAYWGEQAIIDGSWQPPRIEKIG